MPECASCAGFVSIDYIRVFGTGGTVSACPACSTIGDRAEGDGATPTSDDVPGERWDR